MPESNPMLSPDAPPVRYRCIPQGGAFKTRLENSTILTIHPREHPGALMSKPAAASEVPVSRGKAPCLPD